jgi:hypothetical protein
MKPSSRLAYSHLFFLLLLLGGLRANMRAQNKAESTSDWQLWPDLTFNIRLNEQLKYVVLLTYRPGRNVSAVVTKQFGTGLNWTINQNLSGSMQYRYILSDPTERRHSQEHRFYLDVTPRAALGKGFTLVNRTRAEYRQISGVVSGRFRDRLQLEKRVSLHEQTLTPYVAAETYFDTRTHTLSRNQVFLGSRLPVSKHLTFDGFYMHQWDAHVTPGFVHVVGTYLRFEF